jgi:hypothetical protein
MQFSIFRHTEIKDAPLSQIQSQAVPVVMAVWRTGASAFGGAVFSYRGTAQSPNHHSRRILLPACGGRGNQGAAIGGDASGGAIASSEGSYLD